MVDLLESEPKLKEEYKKTKSSQPHCDSLDEEDFALEDWDSGLVFLHQKTL